MQHPGGLPPGLEFARITPEFDEHTIPGGLRSGHRVADGVWGRLVVYSGEVDFCFEDEPEPRRIRSGEHQVIPPARVHHLAVVGPVRLAVEFHRAPTDSVT